MGIDGHSGTRKAATLIAVFVALVIGLSGSSALADDTPVAAPTCVATGAEGLTADYQDGQLSLRGTGFAPLCAATLRVSGPAGAAGEASITADLTGAFAQDAPLEGSTGFFTVDALGLAGATLATTTFEVTLAGPKSSLIVKLASGLSADQAAVIRRNGGVETNAIAPLRLHVVEVASSEADATLQRYLSDAQVTRAELDKTREADATPSDPAYGSQWALPQIGWDDVFGSVNPTGSAKLAVLDTGVSSAGNDLTVGSGWSAFGGDPSADTNGHGTAVASIAAAQADNGTGIAGVSFKNTTVQPVQVLDAAGTGQDSDIIEGVVWAAEHGSDVILMSFSSPSYSPSLQEGIDYAWSQGAVIVAATGNDGSSTPTYPAGDAGVVGVSATDSSDALWSGSNSGQATFLGAPGVGITADSPGGGTTSVSGTSASAAMVAGAAALLKANGAGSNGTIVGKLARSADPAGTQGQTGNGRLNIAQAIADASTAPVTPAGAPGGGPFVGPYTAATNGTITGTVKDSVTNLPISGATVSCAATTPGCNNFVTTTTNAAGSYSLSIQYSGGTATASVTATATSYTSETLSVAVANGAGSQNFSLVPATQSTTTSLARTAGSNPSVYGSAVTFTATVTGTSGNPSGVGTVTFKDGANTICNAVALSGNTATCSPSLAVGTSSLTAVYSGGTGFLGSTSSPALSHSVTPKPLTISGAVAQNKPYDGNTNATVSFTGATLNGVVSGDTVTINSSGYSASFATAAVGTAKAVTVTGVTLGDTSAGNYTVAQPSGLTAEITPKAVTITPNSGQSKVYGTSDPTLTFTNNGGLVATDFTGALGRAAGENVGNYAINLGTLSAGANYSLTLATTTVNFAITKKAASVSAVADTKVYGSADPTLATTNSGFLAADLGAGKITFGASRAAGESVDGSPYLITPSASDGASSLLSNYEVTYNTANFAITKKAASVSAVADTKVYGSADPTLATTNSGFLAADLGAGKITFGASRAAGESVDGSPYLITPSASDGASSLLSNYEVTYNTANFAITKKAASVSAVADTKVYGSADPTLATTNSGFLAADLGAGKITFGASRAAGESVDGSPYLITPSASDGASSLLSNYEVTYNTANFAITKKAITGSFTTPAAKVYDGNTNASVLTRSLNGVVGTDDVGLTGGLANFDNEDVGTNKVVTLIGASLGGTAAGNYSLTSVGIEHASIIQRSLTVTATGVNKVFDGMTTATVTLAHNALATDTVNVGYVSASFADASVGTGKPVSVMVISITGGADASNYSLANTTVSTTANITLLATQTKVTVTPGSRQYSDTVTFKATISPGSAGSVAAATSVTFKVGTLAMGTATLAAGSGTDAGKLVATLADVPLLDASLSSPAGSGPMTPGAKTVTAVINGKNPNFTISDPTTSLTVTQEDARSTYTGDMLAFTPPSGGSATVTLRATIQDITAAAATDPAYDGDPGDIRNAKVTFTSSGGTLSGCANIPVALLGSDTKTGSVSCTGSFPAGNTGSTEYEVHIAVSGYYSENVVGAAVLEVAVPTGTFITGGGYLNETNSAGSKPAANQSKMNFGFNVKYNSKGTNPQGHVNIIYRAGGRVYQIKSNALDSFGTALKTSAGATCVGPPSATCWGISNFTSKANLTDVTNPLAPVSLGGSLSLQMAITDKGEPGKDDTLAVTLWNGSTLLFSSNWSGTKTNEQILGGGNLVVH